MRTGSALKRNDASPVVQGGRGLRLALESAQSGYFSGRSQLGDDSEGNLITLCSECHRAVHS